MSCQIELGASPRRALASPRRTLIVAGVVFLWGVLLCAEPVTVRHREGLVH
jgi:hypothetical protein